MKGIYYFRAGITIFGFVWAFQVAAGITVMPNIINFSTEELPRKDVTVFNDSEENEYVKVTPHIILQPGTNHARKIIIRNPEKYGLLVTPQQLIIPPKEQRLVRLMLTQPLNEQEYIYGVDIVSISKDLVPTDKVKQKEKNMGLKLLVGYGVLAMARPIHPQLNIQAHRQGQTLFLKNKGNSNVEISNIEQCIGKICHPVKNFIRLYAGNSSQISLGFAAPVKMGIQLLDEQKIITSN